MKSQMLGTFSEFEGIMRAFVREQGWQFEFEGESVDPSSVFHEAMFAPGLLQAAQLELQLRGVDVDLGLTISDDPASMFGKRVEFVPERSGLLAMMWRLAQTAYQIETLPKNGRRIQLDWVPSVFAPDAMPMAVRS